MPPNSHSKWWYRVAASNRLGTSDFGPGACVDIDDEHESPFYEAEPPAPAPAPAKLPRLPPEGLANSAFQNGVFFNVLYKSSKPLKTSTLKSTFS